MTGKAILPLIDLVFLTLGSILGVMTEMERVETLPVDITRVGQGASVVKHGRFEIVALTKEGLSLNGEVIALNELVTRVAGTDVVLRADRSLPAGRMVEVIAQLVLAGANVSVEVKETEARVPRQARRQLHHVQD